MVMHVLIHGDTHGGNTLTCSIKKFSTTETSVTGYILHRKAPVSHNTASNKLMIFFGIALYIAMVILIPSLSFPCNTGY